MPDPQRTPLVPPPPPAAHSGPRRAAQGCVGAVKRVLEKAEGVQSVEIDLKTQKVTVKGNVDPATIKDTVAKTGKATEFWQ